MRTSITLAAAACAASLSLAAFAAPASADPRGDAFALTCDNGRTYDIVTTEGRGAWTPGFDAGSTTMFIPLAFGTVTGGAYLASEYPGGEPLFSFEEESVNVKPAKARGLAHLACTFEQSFTEYDPEIGADIIFVATGEVTVGVRR